MTMNFSNNKYTDYFSCYSWGRTGGATLLRPLWLLCPVVGSTALVAGRKGRRHSPAGAQPSKKVPLTGIVRSRECAPASAKRGRRDCNRVPAGKRRRGIRHSPFGGRRIGYHRAPFDGLSCGCRDKHDAAPDSRQVPRASRGLPVDRLPPRSQSAAPYTVGR